MLKVYIVEKQPLTRETLYRRELIHDNQTTAQRVRRRRGFTIF